MPEPYVGHRESNREWWDFADCGGLKPTWWDTDIGKQDHNLTIENLYAITICIGCPVQNECLADALRNGGEHNIRAGLTPWNQTELINTGSTYSRPLRVLNKLLTLTDDVNTVVTQAYGVLGDK